MTQVSPSNDTRTYENFWRARNAWLQTARADWSYTASGSSTAFYALAAVSDVVDAAAYKYYVVGGTSPSSAIVKVSKDGQNWVSGTPASSYAKQLRCAIYFAAKIVIAGESGEIQTCAAGANSWTRRKTGGGDILALACDETLAVAVDSAAHVWTSTDGTSWSDRGAISGPTAAYSVAVSRYSGVVVVCTNNGLYVTTNANTGSPTWTLIGDVPEGTSAQNRVVWSDNFNTFIATSDDGTNTTLWAPESAAGGSVAGWEAGATGSWVQVAATPEGDPGISRLIAVPHGVVGLVVDNTNGGYRMAFYDGCALTLGAFKDTTSDGIYGIAYTRSADRDESALRIVGHNSSDAALYSAVWSPILP